MFRKVFSLALCCSLALCGLVGCSSASAEKDDGKTHIICTVFPEYDWVKEILGEHTEDFNITYLLSNGSDMHSYQPTMDDMVKISSCDLFIYIGGESDEWTEDAVSEAKNKNMKTVNLLEALGSSVKEEEIKEGMQECADENHDHDEEAEYDEHIWLSLGNAEKLCTVIADEICSVDPDNADDYRNNLNSYIDELKTLDSEYSDVLSSVKEKTLVFGDRFPFRYLVDDYGLDYYAAFSGCSAETEASFETITFLADKINELNTDTVFTIEGSDASIAEAIISGTESQNQKIVTLDSIQSVTSEQIKNGTTYISIMKSNLDILKEALN
ncbi:MAG: metal ABC transporter substrate-binding protein [Ruminococcus sp.]|nr:metal ABC transporter substrate-binding protein [Ruminococcus sp.]MDE7138985.1 metal ABC transporter substrate-binding protein [Ruminococcus sp.]